MVKKIISKPFTEVPKTASIIEWASVLKSEYDVIYSNKIPTEVIFFEEKESIKTCLINDKIDPCYEMNMYIMYLYKKFNDHSITEFKRIIKPINNYNILKKLLTGIPELEFLDIFSDIKKI